MMELNIHAIPIQKYLNREIISLDTNNKNIVSFLIRIIFTNINMLPK